MVFHVAGQLGIGGTEKALQKCCEYMNKDMFETVVCGIYKGGLRAKALEEKGFEVHILNGDYSLFESLLREKRADIIHYYLGWDTEELRKVIGIAKGAGVPVVAVTNIFGHYSREPEIQNLVDRQLLISKTVALEYAARGKISMRQFLNKCRVFYIPVDIDEFEKEAPSQEETAQFRQEIGVEPGCPLICRVGRADVRKWDSFPVNMMWFLTRKIPNAKFLAVGGLPVWVQKKISKYHLEKNFIDYGVAFGKELITIYYAIDLLAHSTRIGESFGCTIAEAMAARKPVVVESTPWGDNAQIELVDNGVTGFVATTPRTCADAITHLLRHPAEAERMGGAGYEKARKMFDAKRIVPLLEKHYFELLAAKGVHVDERLLTHYGRLSQSPSNHDILDYPLEYSRRMSSVYGRASLHERVWLKIKQYTQGRPSRAYIFKDSHLHVVGI